MLTGCIHMYCMCIVYCHSATFTTIIIPVGPTEISTSSWQLSAKLLHSKIACMYANCFLNFIAFKKCRMSKNMQTMVIGFQLDCRFMLILYYLSILHKNIYSAIDNLNPVSYHASWLRQFNVTKSLTLFGLSGYHTVIS